MVDTTMPTVCLVACSRRKLRFAAPARHLYAGTLFRKCLRYAEALAVDEVFVLSAKHGLLSVDQVVEPYDVTMNEMNRDEAKVWTLHVLDQLRQAADIDRDHFLILAGEAYRRGLEEHLAHVEVPMRGMGMGEQLQFLMRGEAS